MAEDGNESHTHNCYNEVLVDFRTDFHGSVFEKYHVVPIQVATLEAFCDLHLKIPVYSDFSEVLLQPGNADLLRRDPDSFLDKYGEDFELGWSTADIIDIVEDFLVKSSEMFEEISKKADVNWEESCEDLNIRLIEHALSRCDSETLDIFFHIAQETDFALAKELFNFVKDTYPVQERYRSRKISNKAVQIIDFDLIGADSKRFRLRMHMHEEVGRNENDNTYGWDAEVRDRETGILIATADGSDGTRLNVVAENIVKQRYKPHGDVPTLTRKSGYFDVNKFKLSDEELDESDGRPPRVLSRRTKERLRRARRRSGL
ncbi:hypothetical protein CBR_g38360 [Chara braunii]|uniref:Uncharacterized protein n=1 Tax=Chara braunii TaxID=69332 RepID=A0A388LPZ3_CHABU|nr:hypothetical protein CBR_g38360 [Chara braunii]|eukprot:GBG84387.1 hypothetical protein CBR_g38360 [Chara braunii]